MLWSISAVLILVSFFVFDGSSYLTLTASLIGVTSLIFNAKGYAFGQVLILFSLCYGVISYSFSYYGEMITYLGMTMPMAAIALIVLWTLASLCDTRYISVTVCFAAFLLHDLYGFVNWQRMKKDNALRNLEKKT